MRKSTEIRDDIKNLGEVGAMHKSITLMLELMLDIRNQLIQQSIGIQNRNKESLN